MFFRIHSPKDFLGLQRLNEKLTPVAKIIQIAYEGILSNNMLIFIALNYKVIGIDWRKVSKKLRIYKKYD